MTVPRAVTGLAGKRVAVTRAEEQVGGLREALEAAGATVILCPTIRIDPPESFEDLDAALGRLEAYRWIAFTSSNGVRAVLSRMETLGLPTSALLDERVAAVGSSTARALREQGIRPAFIPSVERSRALAETLEPVAGACILLTRADIADPGVAETLLGRGSEAVDDVVAYRTSLLSPSGEALEELRRGVDGITFTSPSTVRGFLGVGPEGRDLLEDVRVVTLGPATTEVARREGIRVDAESIERSMSGLVEALGRALGGVDELEAT